MAFDREDTLKKAEKLLRQGRLDARDRRIRPRRRRPAARLEHRQHARRPLRPRRPDRQGGRSSTRASPTTSSREGFYPKAAALYKKILKIKPDDESCSCMLAEISAKQGLLADAKATSTPSPTAPARAATTRAPTRSRPPRVARPVRLRRAGALPRGSSKRWAIGTARPPAIGRIHDDLLEKGRVRGRARRAARGRPAEPERSGPDGPRWRGRRAGGAARRRRGVPRPARPPATIQSCSVRSPRWS